MKEYNFSGLPLNFTFRCRRDRQTDASTGRREGFTRFVFACSPIETARRGDARGEPKVQQAKEAIGPADQIPGDLF